MAAFKRVSGVTATAFEKQRGKMWDNKLAKYSAAGNN